VRKKIIVYVKDERSNLNIMTIFLKFIVSCGVLGLDEKFQSTCFDHVFPKVCQYATTNKKVYENFKFTSIKFA
jgi:hypothetical protein